MGSPQASHPARWSGDYLADKYWPERFCSLESRRGFHGSGSRTSAAKAAENPLPGVVSLVWKGSGVRGRSGPPPRRGKALRRHVSRQGPVPEALVGQKAETEARSQQRGRRDCHAACADSRSQQGRPPCRRGSPATRRRGAKNGCQKRSANCSQNCCQFGAAPGRSFRLCIWSRAVPQGDSNPCYRLERALSPRKES